MKTENFWKGLMAAAALAMISAQPAAAVPPVSANHTLYGVSQLWAGHGNARDNVALRLRNPNRMTHVAAVLVYDRARENSDLSTEGESEVFRSCLVRELTPHASISVGSGDFGFFGVTGRRYYAEVIAVPRNLVPVRGQGQGRMGDSLGIIAGGGGDDENRLWAPVTPNVFTLPFDHDVAGQSQDAVDCVCFLLEFEQVPTNVFNEFGITCTN